MTSRAIAGGIFAAGYNMLVGKLPLHSLRRAYLQSYLGELGAATSVQTGCRFLNGRKVFLGQRNVINFDCLFDGRRYSIRTGADVSIGPEATILTLAHDPQDPEFSDKGGDVIIGDRVWIAYRATILPGVKIGEGAVVAAGAVVVSNIEPFTIVGGVPARKVGVRNRDLHYSLTFRPFLL
jgi:acetyltransferase-like isoleucine patch superfamily enzyme